MNEAGFLQFIDVEGIPEAVVILVVGVLGLRAARRFLDGLAERMGAQRLAVKQFSALLGFIVWGVLAVLTLSSVLVLRSEAVLALGGTVGLALGFAFKDLAASLMAGVILLFDRPFQVGDRVAYGPYYGEVKEIGLRSVRLVTLDDNLVTIPNGNFLSDAVSSANAGALDCMVVVPVYVAASEDFLAAREIVQQAALTSPYVYLEKPVVTLVSDEFLGERFVTVIRLKAYVLDARFEKAFASDITLRVKTAFRDEGIHSPDQQYRDLEINTGREAPPPAG